MQKGKEMENNISIQDATLNDLESIFVIEQDTIDVPWNKQSIEEYIKREDVVFRVLFLEKKLIGYYSFSKIFDEGNINNIAVDKYYQSKGFGKMLIEDMLNMTKKYNINALTLEVADNNNRAIGLYKKYGFIEEGRRKKYYNNKYDAIIMWLR